MKNKKSKREWINVHIQSQKRTNSWSQLLVLLQPPIFVCDTKNYSNSPQLQLMLAAVCFFFTTLFIQKASLLFSPLCCVYFFDSRLKTSFLVVSFCFLSSTLLHTHLCDVVFFSTLGSLSIIKLY
jgi:hypothetical protein